MSTHSSILPGKSQGQRSLAGYIPYGHKESDMIQQLNNKKIYFTQQFFFKLRVFGLKTLPFNAGVMGLVPGQGAKIPHSLWPKNQNIKQKRYCNKFSKDLKKEKPLHTNTHIHFSTDILVVVQLLSCVRLLRPHGLQPTRLLYPWDFPVKNTGVGCHFLLQGIFPTQESNPGLLHCRQILYRLSYEGSLPTCQQVASCANILN